MKFINLTPHEVNIYNEDKELVLNLPSSGQVRLATTRRLVQTLDHVPLYEVAFNYVEGLPEWEADTILVVPLVVRQHIADRNDLYSPGELLRNEAKQPVGCIGLSR